MPTDAMNAVDRALLDAALEQARKSAAEGGIPIGAAIGTADGEVLASAHNRRVQDDDPTAHAEMSCLRATGRRRDWPDLVFASTLSPCIMCTGALLLFRVGRLVIGESENFLGAEDLFEDRGNATLVHARDPDCIGLMRKFIEEQPDLWNEDIGL
ncbi:MAG: nucleoside deaminase [Planctomycetota bacterium]